MFIASVINQLIISNFPTIKKITEHIHVFHEKKNCSLALTQKYYTFQQSANKYKDWNRQIAFVYNFSVSEFDRI